MGEFSLTHWLIVIAILLIFFGPSRLPGLGKSIGEAIKGFKDGISPDEQKNNQAQSQPPPAPPAQLNQPTASSQQPQQSPAKKQEENS